VKPAVAFFTDSFHEANGVALTSREFDRFAYTRGFPFFSVHAGPVTKHHKDGAYQSYEIANSRATLRLEHDLFFDTWFLCHRRRLVEALREFRPDLVHVTGPGHCGLLGAIAAHDLGVPLVASWHTNVHEFGARRLTKMLRRWPAGLRRRLPAFAERKSLDIILWFYRRARMLFAPNPELVHLLETRTGQPAHLMVRGVDTTVFSPTRRAREHDELIIGHVGRLSAEKNVRMLAVLERLLMEEGIANYRFLVVGEGGERAWLRENLRRADLPGLLRGVPLAEAYAEMDVFVFPSETDTYGNVTTEALASGVPAIVSAHGGPKFLVREGVDGFVATDAAGFARAVMTLYRDRQLLARMKQQAREAAERKPWPVVFESIYENYERGFASGVLPRAVGAGAASESPHSLLA
jgi:glycosyltransferase involved in cell wall biosynthesis